MAEWLNSNFMGLDKGVFSFVNSLNCGFLNAFCKYFTIVAEKGLIWLLIGAILFLFPKTRKVGICIIGAVALSWIFNNVVLKNIVERERPFDSSSLYQRYWIQAGAMKEISTSFPSGHAASTMAFAIAIFFFFDKRWSFVGFILALIMGFSRVYLICHYTTDVLAGYIVGAVSAIIALHVTFLILRILNKSKDNKFCNFLLYFDIRNVFKKTGKKTNKKGD